MLLSTQQILVCFLLLPNSSATGQSKIWSVACLGLVSDVAQMGAFTRDSIYIVYGQVYTMRMMSTFGGLHSMLLSTQQILVCFVPLPSGCA